MRTRPARTDAGEERAQLIEENDSEKKPTRHPWAWLLRRVFAVEVLVCVHCAGKLRLVEIAGSPDITVGTIVS